MAGSLRMYAISKVPNSNILGDTTTGKPALPTIGELNRPLASKVEWIWRGRRSLFFLSNGEFIIKVKLHQHLQPLLAAPASTASDVYLVFRPGSLKSFQTGSLQHCSFYTQGVFYHLSAPDLSRHNSRKSPNTDTFRDITCMLRCEDLSIVSLPDYNRLCNSSGRKVLVAYKVVHTDYRSDQILLLAEWAVRQLSVYGLFAANCQHFATIMVRRTVMRMGDRSAFAGTATQIVDWDLERESQPHVNCLEHGFLIAPPLPVDESMLSGFISTCSHLFGIRGYIDPFRIKILYEKGPNAIGAWHPPEYYAKNFREHGLLIYNACADFKEDLGQKRWKDALYGRYKELPDGTMKRPLQRSSKKDKVELTRTISSLPQSPTHHPDS